MLKISAPVNVTLFYQCCLSFQAPDDRPTDPSMDPSPGKSPRGGGSPFLASPFGAPLAGRSDRSLLDPNRRSGADSLRRASAGSSSNNSSGGGGSGNNASGGGGGHFGGDDLSLHQPSPLVTKPRMRGRDLYGGGQSRE